MMAFSVGRIDFINTAPVYYGIDTGRVDCPGRTLKAPPAVLNGLLLANEIQISAISSVAYATAYPRWLILPDLSISSHGAVRSVLLCLKRPVEEGGNRRIGLSDKSATARALTRILLEDVHGTTADYRSVDASKGIPGDLDGVLVIGDDALRLDPGSVYPHVIDLGTFWDRWTGLPFVFGLWAVDRAFARNHPEETAAVAAALCASKEIGKEDLQGAAREAARRAGVPEAACRSYLSHIEYDLQDRHLEGLRRFFDLLKARGELNGVVEPVFWSVPGEEAQFGT